MTYLTIEDVNGTGIAGLLQTTSSAVPIMPALILFALWSVLTFGMFYANVRRVGRGDFVVCWAVGGFVTVLISFLMQLIPRFITNYTIVPIVVIEIIAIACLLMKND